MNNEPATVQEPAAALQTLPNVAMTKAVDAPLALARRPSYDLPLAELAESMYLSGMFKDLKSVHQAKVKIPAGRELGVPPVQAMNSLYIIEGKVAMAAALMGGLILRDGRYKYRVTQLDDSGCTISFYERNDMQEWTACGPPSTFSRADAQVAQLLGKEVWKKWFRNMAFSRALSNGARWYCSDIFLGPVYVPEELGAIVNEDGDVVTVEIPTQADGEPKPDRNDWQREAAKSIYPRVAPNVAERVRENARNPDISSEDFTSFLVDVAKIHGISIPPPPQQPQEASYVDIAADELPFGQHPATEGEAHA
ncbi:MAG: hypothetical protein M5R41_19345 [Bacteroidia bacterium]|nr:hypothetical protein [Bacteroidia bacterium]